MKRDYPELSELMIRAMKPPEEVDISRFQLIPFTGKLSKLTGIKHIPYMTKSYLLPEHGLLHLLRETDIC